MKKLLTVLLATLMVLTLVGCGKKEEVLPEEPLVDDAPTAKDNYASYSAAALDTEVEVLMSVQAHQGWWNDNGVNKVTIYGQDDDGAYFVYECNVDEATANAMTPGTLIRVKGYKSEWSGEIEIADSTAEIIAGGYDGKVYEAKDVTEFLANEEELAKYMNQFVTMKNLEVTATAKKDSEWDPDLYITIKSGDASFDLCVENYLAGPDTEVYKNAETIKVGDVIDIEGFLYWYNGPNPHVTKVTIK